MPYRRLFAGLLLAAMSAAPAHASADCVVEADPPRSGAVISAVGRFTCATPRPGMTITVCLEYLGNGPRSPWLSNDCRTVTAGSPVQVVEAVDAGCPHGLLYRTAAWASNADGSYGEAQSITVPAFCLLGRTAT